MPLITFELESDAGHVSVADVLNDASGSVIKAEDRRELQGYAAYGGSISEALAPLLSLTRFVAADRNGRLEEVAGKRLVHIRSKWLGCGSSATAPTERRRIPDSDLPATVSITYYDPALNYQQGEQHVHAGSGGRLRERMQFPGVLRSDEAKVWADAALTRAWHQRGQVTLKLPLYFSELVPGDPVELPRTSLEREVVATAHGLRDEDGKSSARLIVQGESMRAPAPVDLKAEPTATGDLMVSWRGRTFHDLESESLIDGGSLARDHKYMVVVRGAEDSISLQVATETTEIPGNLLQAFRGEELVVEVADVSGLISSKACSVVIDW
jgi:hypothetical protein